VDIESAGRLNNNRFGWALFILATVLGVIWLFSIAFTLVDAARPAASVSTLKFSDDADVIVTSVGLSKSISNVAPVGASAPGVEATNDLPRIHNTLHAGNYEYTFQVKEAAVDSWKAGEEFMVEVYGGGTTDPDLLATLYTQQAEANEAAIDGVTVTVDLGSPNSIPDNLDIVVSHQ